MENACLPSLRWFASVKFAVHLWKQNVAINAIVDSQAFLSAHSIPKLKLSWRPVENIVVQKLHSLGIPQSVKEQVLKFVIAIGWEIAIWMWHIREMTGRNTWIRDDIINIYFTSEGLLDKRLCALSIVEDTNFDTRERYILACVYCLEDHIKSLRSESSRINIKGLKYPVFEICKFWHSLLRKNTRATSSNDTNNYENIYKNEVFISNRYTVFRYSIHHGLEEASKFMWNSSNQEEKGKSELENYNLLKGAIDPNCDASRCNKTPIQEYYCNAILCIFFKMDKKNQDNILKNVPRYIVYSFLSWPRQHMFMKIVHRTKDYLSKRDYIYILQKILDKISHGYEDYDYKVLFNEYWEVASKEHKEFVLRVCVAEGLLEKLLQIMDTGIITSVLRAATPEERQAIFATPDGIHLRRKLHKEGKRELLQLIKDLCTESHYLNPT